MIGILLNEKQQAELESLLHREIKSLASIQCKTDNRLTIKRALREKEEILNSVLRLIQTK